MSKITQEELMALIKAEDWKAVEEADVSEIMDMSYMFQDSKFDGDISKWDVSDVEDMRCMFYNSKFNGDVSKWDVSNVKDMFCMFGNSKFNGDISGWNVSNVNNMTDIFHRSKFTGNIDNWIISEEMLKTTTHPHIREKTRDGLFIQNYDSNGIRLWKLANL